MADSIAGFNFEGCAGRWTEIGDSGGYVAAIVAGLRKGDDWAYEALIHRFQTPVYNVVYRLISEPGDASDVVQEVFIKVFRAIGSFRGQSSLKTWIYRIAINEALNHRRWVSRWRRREIRLDDEQRAGVTYEDTLADDGPSPFDMTVDHETRARIEEGLRQLRAPYREVLVLREVEGLGYEEIAEVLQISLGTVKSRIVRGREALRAAVWGKEKTNPALQWVGVSNAK
jgi:RNA polymerase sigma-70 factor (ECF subfamily)